MRRAGAPVRVMGGLTQEIPLEAHSPCHVSEEALGRISIPPELATLNAIHGPFGCGRRYERLLREWPDAFVGGEVSLDGDARDGAGNDAQIDLGEGLEAQAALAHVQLAAGDGPLSAEGSVRV